MCNDTETSANVGFRAQHNLRVGDPTAKLVLTLQCRKLNGDRTAMLSIPVTLEQLIIAVQQLQPDERAQLANALIQAGLRSDLTALIQELYTQPPVDDITDDDIMAEIQAARQQPW